MKAVFLADAHLRGKHSPGYPELIDFFAEMRAARRSGVAADSGIWCDELFILGDFFDFWFSRGDRIHPPFREVLEALVALRDSGIRIRLCEGNHDFLLRDYFSRHPGMEILPDWAEVNLDGCAAIVSHGDDVSNSDPSYRVLRSLLRSNFFYRLQGMLPLPLLCGAAELFARSSRNLGRQRGERLAEKMHAAAREKLAVGPDAVILGHCHQPLIKYHDLNGRPAASITLGGWNNLQTYLYFDDGFFSLRRYTGKR